MNTAMNLWISLPDEQLLPSREELCSVELATLSVYCLLHKHLPHFNAMVRN
jgi:hypothetical protein